MIRIGRRDLVGWMALVPLGCALPLASAARGLRPVLSGEFVLARVLDRELTGGASLRVEREWSCRFAPSPEGTSVLGEQIACRVEAPAALAALAEIERTREVVGFLPLTLDGNGSIAASPADPSPGIDAALAAANRLFGPNATPGDRSWMAALGQTAAEAVSVVPADLFFPATGPVSFTRELPLPDGAAGTVTIEASARVRPDSGLLIESTRQIVTSAGGFARRATESWTLETRRAA